MSKNCAVQLTMFDMFLRGYEGAKLDLTDFMVQCFEAGTTPKTLNHHGFLGLSSSLWLMGGLGWWFFRFLNPKPPTQKQQLSMS